jgi:hypothetical protein
VAPGAWGKAQVVFSGSGGRDIPAVFYFLLQSVVHHTRNIWTETAKAGKAPILGQIFTEYSVFMILSG